MINRDVLVSVKSVDEAGDVAPATEAYTLPADTTGGKSRVLHLLWSGTAWIALNRGLAAHANGFVTGHQT